MIASLDLTCHFRDAVSPLAYRWSAQCLWNHARLAWSSDPLALRLWPIVMVQSRLPISWARSTAPKLWPLSLTQCRLLLFLFKLRKTAINNFTCTEKLKLFSIFRWVVGVMLSRWTRRPSGCMIWFTTRELQWTRIYLSILPICWRYGLLFNLL